MDDKRHDLESRLADYRPVVEGAMAKRPLTPKGRGHKSRWVVSMAAAGTVAAGVLGWFTLRPTDTPASTGIPVATTTPAPVTARPTTTCFITDSSVPVTLAADSDPLDTPPPTMMVDYETAAVSPEPSIVPCDNVELDANWTCESVAMEEMPPQMVTRTEDSSITDVTFDSLAGPFSELPEGVVELMTCTNDGFVAVDQPAVIAVGDALTVSATSSLESYGITVDAVEAGTLADVLNLLPSFLGEASRDTVVLAVGNAHAIDPGELYAVIDALSEAGVPYRRGDACVGRTVGG